MRDFLDSILDFIGAETLTDEEYAGTQPMESNPGDFSQEVYDALKDVLTARESISSLIYKLKAYFLAAGTTNVESSAPTKVPASQILIGVALD